MEKSKTVSFQKDRSKTLYLLDGMPLCYRGYFALIRNPITNSAGLNTSAVYVYTNTLLDILRKGQPTHIAVAFDTSAPTHRHQLYPAYKAQREEMPEELSAMLPFIIRMTEALNIPILKCDGYEADDIIGTLAKRAENEGMLTYMVTTDKDFAQLVSPKTLLYKPSRIGDGVEVLGVSEVLERYKLKSPEQLIDLLGLWGDASDNIPGVPGVGEKTAIQLLNRYASVEDILAHTHELKGKQRENLEKFADQAQLSKQLATILTDIPLDVSLESLQCREKDDAALKELLSELEFASIGKRLFGEAFKARSVQGILPVGQMDTVIGEKQPTTELKSAATVPHDYVLVDSQTARSELIERLKAQKSFCFDTETTSLNPQEAELVGLAFAFQPHAGFYVPFPPDAKQSKAILDEFRPVFESLNIEKIGHNLKYDLSILYWYGVKVQGPLFDTLLAAALVAPEQRHRLDSLAEIYLGYRPIAITHLIGDKGTEQISMRDVPVEQIVEYAVEDADMALQLKTFFESGLKRTGQEKVFYEVECPLIPTLVSMEASGVALDVEALRAYSQKLEEEIRRLSAEIQTLAGTAFNINSPKQLGQILFDILKIDPKAKKTKTGQYATNEQVLMRLAPQHEIVQKILEYRVISKLKNTYVDVLPESISLRTGRVHTSYGQLNTVTGRLQSSSPNLQNIPIRTEQGREIRKAFIAGNPEYLFLSADYSQIELRVIAGISEDASMLEAFREGVDIHSATAARIYGLPTEDITREMRSKAKMVNFGIPYGISAFGLAQRLGVSRTEAAALIDAYFKQFPGILNYIEKTLDFARENGYVETLTGRRRYLSEIHSANATIRASAERNAINMPIQGTAADMIKIAMTRIHHELDTRKLRTRLLLQIHDELIFELFRPEKEHVCSLVEEAMKNALPLNVPITVEMGTGHNWLQAH